MFRDGPAPPVEKINIFLNSGGMGDNIAALPAVRAALKQSRVADFTLWVPDYFVEFTEIMFPDEEVKGFSRIKERIDSDGAVQTLSKEHTPMRMHLVDFSATMLIDKALTDEEKNYLRFPVESVDISKFQLIEPYVVLTPGYTAEVREWKPEIVNEISSWLYNKGILPVFLGSEDRLLLISTKDQEVDYKGNFNKQIDYTCGVDLINKTSLPEAAAIMAKAKAVVGLDNGLLHLAGCTDVPIVGGFTTVEPKYRMPYRNNILGWNFFPVVPPESLACRFCQSNWSFVYSPHDFRTCWYKEQKLDSEIQCVKQASADLYINQLITVLE